jgi:hypothetical protein
MDGTGAALRHAATVLGAGHPELLADHPQQRRIVLRLVLLTTPLTFSLPMPDLLFELPESQLVMLPLFRFWNFLTWIKVFTALQQ